MRGLFVGLMTLDCIYQAQRPPQANEKLVAQAAMMAAGGPATNAAVAFAALGGQATVMAAVGQHPVTALLREDMAQVGVTLRDLSPSRSDPPPLSSIVVSQSGDRAVISRNAEGLQIDPQTMALDGGLTDGVLTDVNVVLLDGHQMALSQRIALMAKSLGIPVVVDAGSWKPGFDQVLALAQVVIASANFRPPDPHGDDGMAYFQGLGIPQIAITQGEYPIVVSDQGRLGELAVPATTVVDTLGAGDIFHGAFCHAICDAGGVSFSAALTQASQVASLSCRYFGTRAWIPYSN
ncbi:PfkB family carbohydrate kinase [Leptothoe sp. PORK10 BA2]|uniref:PfkB family carbohydrate kinase n=1 Tax=Leptothoe sp. PORK10 BA2 TaxID=3110254 RepID=UPI002B1EFB7F|nr:PfkB family carbohydrate kinase [Leptothoe sp. PORK10 BA2]MEA5462724.1 PfkB family carbohydrate kinase [Leptothoe sp. PORK10 BA2]